MRVADPPPLVGLLEAAVAQHQCLRAHRNQSELVLDLPVALRLVDELTAAQVHLQLRQQVLSALITLTHTRKDDISEDEYGTTYFTVCPSDRNSAKHISLNQLVIMDQKAERAHIVGKYCSFSKDSVNKTQRQICSF